MKRAFQKDEALLRDIRQTIDGGGTRLWWLGQSGFLIIQRGRGLLLDPYLSDSLTRKYAGTARPHVRITERVVAPEALGGLGILDVITSSHNHTDHLDADTLQPLLKAMPNCKLVIPGANRDFVVERIGQEFAERLVEVDGGEVATTFEFRFFGIPAAHPTVERDFRGRCRFLGYVVQWHDLAVYHSGDTLWHEGLVPNLSGFRIDLALLPINGDRPERGVAGNLDGKQAARLAKAIGARTAVPCHFDLFEFNTASPDEFVAECAQAGQDCHVLACGEGRNLT